ncbi:zinc-binding alcohol dehydrogenase family protein [Rhodococcus opacus]|nr:zinc-binding alcohol dehydrogenase family protein [Rhodococcus opacus]
MRCWPAIATRLSVDYKIESVCAIGAERGFLYTDPDWVEQVVDATGGGGGVDVVISGTGANLAEALGCLRPGGRIAVFGSSAGRRATFEVPVLYFGQFTMLGTSWAARRISGRCFDSSTSTKLGR